MQYNIRRNAALRCLLPFLSENWNHQQNGSTHANSHSDWLFVNGLYKLPMRTVIWANKWKYETEKQFELDERFQTMLFNWNDQSESRKVRESGVGERK
jgi:hypothetical protein